MTAPRPRGDDDAPLLEVEDLRVEYRVGGGFRKQASIVRAVDGIDFSVRRGRTLGLVGESGCGKTTTAKAVLRLEPVASGRIHLDGVDVLAQKGAQLRATRRRMQMVFQDPLSSLDPRKTVGKIVREPLDIHGVGSGEQRRQRVTELIGLVGLSPRIIDRYPHQFSGGQRQRIGIARALALEPDLIVADEPISALDVSIQAQITNLLQELQERLGIAYLYIAHDLAVVRHICHEVAVMYLGKIVETSTTADVFDAATHPYTLALLSAVPIPDPEIEARRRRIILTGDVPSAAKPPSGCHFHTRCWLRQRLGDPDICATTDPPLATADGLTAGHRVACHFTDESIASPERAAVVVAPQPASPPAGPDTGPPVAAS